MRIARPGDRIYAMDFTERTGPFERLTAEQLRNPGGVTVPAARGSGSAVYDAIATAICRLRHSKNPRQAIIVITDGIDEHSRLSLSQLVDAIRSQRAQLFLIGLHSKSQFRFQGHIDPTIALVTGHDIDNPDYVFYRLAEEAAVVALLSALSRVGEEASAEIARVMTTYFHARDEPGAPQQLQMARCVGERQPGPIVEVLDAALALPEMLQ